MTPGLLEIMVDAGRAEAMAREGVCPGCCDMAFIGHGRTADDVEVGTCLCRNCMVVWQYTLAARWRWN